MNKQLNIGLVGPLPPPSGGMANQTAQLARLLEAEGIHVEVIQVNPPYRPGWIAPLKGIRALFRLSDYLGRLWRAVGEVQLIHIMANSGWSWHLFVTPAVLIARLRGVPVVINYRGGEAETFFRKSFFWVKPILKRAKVVAVPSGFLEQVFQKYHIETTIVPNIIDLTRFSPADKNNEVLDSAFDEPNGPHIVVARN